MSGSGQTAQLWCPINRSIRSLSSVGGQEPIRNLSQFTIRTEQNQSLLIVLTTLNGSGATHCKTRYCFSYQEGNPSLRKSFRCIM